MRSTLRLSRRRAVGLVGAVGLSAVGAGCLDDETSTGADETSETGSTDGDTDSRADDANGDEGERRILPPGSRIILEARSTGWVGVAPSTIEGEENPTLVLSAGASYEIEWVGDDGEAHGVELRDESDTVVDDLPPADASAPEADRRLEFEASEELAAYVCGTRDAMRGAIEIAPAAADSEEAEVEPEVRHRIEPGESIAFDGRTAGWIGVSPSTIEGEENPALVLEEGASYEIGWIEGDHAAHNVELRDEDDGVVDDYATEIVDDPGDDQFLAFEASADLAYYVCRPHESTMRGQIRVE